MYSYISILNLKKDFSQEEIINLNKKFLYQNISSEKNFFLCSNSNINNIKNYQSQSTKLTIIFNGRIYNKEELLKLLNLEKNINNTDLVLQLFLKYGENIVEKIIGDWSVLIYDYDNKEYFIAQDHHGYTAVYYYLDNDYIVVATNINLMKKLNFLNLSMDIEKVICRDAVIFFEEDDTTFYKEIKLLNPAHKARINKKEVNKQRYWFPENIEVDYTITLDEAVRKVDELFTEAVRCRIQSDKPIASMLSGGLDSTSVSTVASELLKEKNQTLHTYSHVPQFDIRQELIGNRNGDESKNMKAVVEKCGNINPNYLNSSHMTPLEGVRLSNKVYNEPIHAALNAYWLMDIYNSVSKNNHEVLLSGEMGNATISYEGIHYLLDVNKLYQYFGLKSLIKNKILRTPYSKYYKPFINRFKKNVWSEYSYLNPILDKEIKELIKKSKRDISFNFHFTKDDEKEAMKKILMFGFNKRCEGGSNFSQYYGLHLSDPTGDKRLIEYMLKIPNELYVSKENREKNIIKQFMKDRLPYEVLFQRNKGLQSADIIDRIQVDIPKIEAIVNDFDDDLVDFELFDKKRILNNLALLKKKELSVMDIHHLFRSIGIIDFLIKFKGTSKNFLRFP